MSSPPPRRHGTTPRTRSSGRLSNERSGALIAGVPAIWFYRRSCPAMTVWCRKLAGKEKSMRAIIIIISLSILMLTLPAYGQQTYVGRYDVYGGFMYLHTPAINLGEPGFHLQGGVRLTSWVSGGFDYTVGTGNTSLTSNMLLPSLQQKLGAQLGQMAAAGLIPAG